MTDLCNVDGRIVPEADATVPVLDRGFLFGDSVYEVLRTRDGVPFAWREHLARLRGSAAAIALDLDPDDAGLMRPIVATIAASRRGDDGERYVRLIVTRGTGTAPSIDPEAVAGPPRIVVIVRALPADRCGAPTRVALVARVPAPGRQADPAVKSGNYVTNVRGLVEARRRGAAECVFVDGEGFATEASTANLYAVLDGELHTPPVGSGLLAGITRGLLLVCAREAGVVVQERRIRREALLAAQEVFLSGTVRELAPVTHLDDQPVGTGEPGPLTRRLQAAFEAFCAARARADAAALAALVT